MVTGIVILLIVISIISTKLFIKTNEQLRNEVVKHKRVIAKQEKQIKDLENRLGMYRLTVSSTESDDVEEVTLFPLNIKNT